MSTSWDDPTLPSARATEINKERRKTYGDPTPNMVFLASRWTTLIGHYISPQMAAMMLVDLKIMREVQAGFPLDYSDNLDDICGWTNVVYLAKGDRRESV